jgi:hypothetical protein
MFREMNTLGTPMFDQPRRGVSKIEQIAECQKGKIQYAHAAEFTIYADNTRLHCPFYAKGEVNVKRYGKLAQLESFEVPLPGIGHSKARKKIARFLFSQGMPVGTHVPVEEEVAVVHGNYKRDLARSKERPYSRYDC